MSSTNTYTSAPTCENCGRDKQATYICDPCCDKLNAMHRDLLAERDRLAAENAELRAEKNYAEVDANKYRAVMIATLDRLREALNDCVEPKCSSQEDYADLIKRIDAILYPKEINNDLGKCESS